MTKHKKRLAVLIAVLLPFFTAYASESVTKNSFFPFNQPLGFLLLVLVFAAILCILWALINRLHVAFAITFTGVFLLSCVSYFKYIARGEPLYVSDFAYLFKITGVADSGNIVLTPTIVVSFLLGVLLTVLCYKMVVPQAKRLHRFGALCASAIFLCAFFFLSPALSPATEGQFMLNYLKEAATYSDQSGYNVDADFNKYTKNNLESQVAKIQANIPETKQYSEEKPNVIVILSESFSDISNMSGIQLSEEPIPNFKALSETAVSGNMISSTFGGGTANVEYEIQTGFLNKAIATTSSAFETYLDQPTMSLASILQAHGYKTLGLHTYMKDFYKRDSVYPFLGYDSFVGVEDLDNPPLDGYYVSDAVITDLIIENYESAEEPVFIFAITMENHQPYNQEKYTETDIKVLNDDMPAELRESVEAYLHGIHHSDQELMRLVNYFKEQPEPTVIMFFGDHQPTIGADFGLYRYTGDMLDAETRSKEEFRQVLTTPFLIWSNYKDTVEHVENIGPNFIGNYLLNYIQIEKPLFYYFLDQIYEEVHYLSRDNLFIDSEDTLCDKMPDEYDELIDMYKLLQYDILLGEGYVADMLQALQ